MESTPFRPDRAQLIDLGRLLRQLEALPDPRHPKGLRSALAPLLRLVVLAKLVGQDHPSGIADWISSRGQPLRTALHLRWPHMPHHSTDRRRRFGRSR